MTVLNPGPLMIDVEGCQLTIEDRELIAHPRVGGIVLFTRNYENPAQLQSLIADIRSARNGALLVAVDHEGGRVQRFRAGFTRVPPMRLYGELFDHDASEALQMLTDTCRLVAFELAGCDIDFTFAPCIDIDHSLASVIGDRALHSSVDGVVALGKAALDGYRAGGMAGVIKHFPGHGCVQTDTHFDFATDSRTMDQISCSDMAPFAQLLNDTAAVMPAHVIYSEVDDLPASLSAVWQSQILRQQLGFDGAIVSDDLSMKAATGIAHQSHNASRAVAAGTDLALICNDRAAASVACDNDEIPLGGEAQVRRRLNMRRSTPVRELRDGERNSILSKLLLLSHQPAC